MIGNFLPHFVFVLRYPLLGHLTQSLSSVKLQHILNSVPQAVQLHTHKFRMSLKKNRKLGFAGTLLGYLISEESCEVLVLSGQVLIVQLGETGCQHMFTAEERMMGEDEAGYIYIQLVVCLGVAHSSYVEVHMLGLQSLGQSRQQWKHHVIMQTFIMHYTFSEIAYKITLQR